MIYLNIIIIFKFILPLDVLDKQTTANWIEVCNAILIRPVPDVIILVKY